MPVLLMRFQGPMQSWGTQSQFLIRDTGLEPSKSGVIGLLCAALGKPRQEAPGSAQRWPLLRDLTAMRMAVRVDNPGIVMRDYHTAGGSRRQDRYGVVSADGSAVSTVVSQRFYLADAAFLVGMESENMALLEKLHAALRNPVWPLSLGRKAFPPGLPVCLPDGLRHEGLLEAIGRYPSLVDRADEQTNPLRVVADASPEEASEVRYDVPVDFAARRFTVRHVKLSLLDPRNMEGRPCISQG